MLPSYQPNEAAEFLSAHGVRYKPTGEELVFYQCPYCSKKDHFYLNNTTGAFKCHSGSCGQAGNFFTYRRDFFPVIQPLTQPKLEIRKVRPRKTFADFAPFETNLGASPSAQKYLATRGISPEAITQWHLGLKTDSDGDWLMIPYITQQGNIADVKYRLLPPGAKRFRRWGGESILFGEHLLPEKKQSCETLYLCEGELDCITLTQHGFSPALSTTTGAGSFSPRWYDLIVSSGAKRIVLVYDSDVDGQAGADKLAKKFNDEDRIVFNVILQDCKDANEFFQTRTAEDFQALVDAARPVEMDHIISMAGAIDQLEEQLFLSGSALNGIPSIFPNVNALIDGGYWNGFLVTVLGGSGTGKTSFMLQELLAMASSGFPTYMCCLEMPVEMMLRKVINQLYHVPMKDIKPFHIAQYRDDLMKRQLYFGGGIRNVTKLEEVFRRAAKRYDLKAICFDNISYLCRSREHNEAELGIVTKALKDLAVELNIPIFAIVQPNKFDRAERVITENDAKGSSAIEQDSDIMMLMWRPTLRTDITSFGKTMGEASSQSPLTLIRIGKARYSPGGETMLYLHGEVGTFRQLAENEQQQLTEQVAPPEKKRRGYGG